MLPLEHIDRAVAIAAVATLSLAAFALICAITINKLRIDRRLGWFLAIGAISLQPVFKTFELGQINLILMALVMLDCLVVPPRYRGLGVGLAAGIKIVPAIFVLYFVLRRDWRAVAQSGVTFVATVVVSAIVTPHETLSYWTHLKDDAARTGDMISGVNQSVPAVVARLMHDRFPPTVLVALAALCCIAFAVLAARKQLARGNDLAALVCIAIGGLLASPVSWSHHYVWAAPALIILFLEKHTVDAALGAAIFYVAPWQNNPVRQRGRAHLRSVGVVRVRGIPAGCDCVVGLPILHTVLAGVTNTRIEAPNRVTERPFHPRRPNHSGMPPAQVNGRHAVCCWSSLASGQ